MLLMLAVISLLMYAATDDLFVDDAKKTPVEAACSLLVCDTSQSNIH